MPLAQCSRALSAPFLIAISAAILAGQPAWGQAVRPETVAAGLENPWGVAFLPDGRFLVTERAGRMRVVAADGKLAAALAGLPPVAAGGQGGLLDVLADSDFARNRTVYFCYSEPAASGSGNST
ncbi:MAG: PQQ-dependent sugar dehydrogenase, partial [Bacteroidia bacterium]|nr:PQQ-dependent sugar dehydrogenase [Bacteroidia bacterium]